MDDEKYAISFQMITEAGDARNKALNAIDMVQEYKFPEADALLKEAKASIILAHKIQTNLIHQEISGEPVESNILMVHSQDHFAMATTTIDLAEKMIKLYKKLHMMEKRMETAI